MKASKNNAKNLVLAIFLSGICPTNTVFADNAFASDSRWALGDWNGNRQALFEKGIEFELNHFALLAGGLDGGYTGHSSGRYKDQWTAGINLDLNKLAGWQNTTAQIQFIDRNGRGLDQDLMDDPRASFFTESQKVHGRGNVTRISELWLAKGFFNDDLNIKGGKFTVGEEFASQDCLFQGLAFCGSQLGNYVNDIYNSPISSWALRARYNLTNNLRIKVAAYNINPIGLENDNALKLRTHGSTGTLLPIELIWQPEVSGLPGEYRTGYYRNTASRDDVYSDVNGKAAALTGADYRTHNSRHGWWVAAKQQVTTRGGESGRGITLYASATFHDRATNPVDSYQHVSLIYKGPFDARPRDTFGVGLARIHASSRFLRNAKVNNEASGLSYEDPAFVPEQHTSYVAEINYGFQVTGWLNVMPNLQYVRHPGGVREVDDSVIMGLQIGTTF